jgi:hypothetical protein
MKKKRVVFSSSGGAPAMILMNRIMEAFGSDEIETIAARIAATCRTTPVIITPTLKEEYMELKGNTANCISVNNDIILIKSENIKVSEKTLIIE